MLRSAVNIVGRLWRGFQQGGQPPRVRPAAKQTGDTLLQQDPVCGTYVSVETSLRKLTGGRVYHFCSAECRDRFRT
ncbi:MAG: YHS domain-containing protein [Acidobacteriota bacterium]